MGESKLPIYAYVDETGNTGHNLFDEVQPNFYTAALISKGDFDTRFRRCTSDIADKIGTQSLHGKEIGMQRLNIVADDIINLLSAANAKFFVSRVEKKYLLGTKVFDTLFDSGENAAVPWHTYNLRPLKIMMAFKTAYILDGETARLFWKCILEPSKAKVLTALPEVCNRLLANLHRLPDERSREILGDGLRWARDNPETIQIHTDQKIARQGHFPNLVAFGNLLEGLEAHSKLVNRKVARITHDKQSEFEKTLRAWHELFSHASPEPITWAGETYSFQRVVGSTFQLKPDQDSPGLQITDIILWLYHQFHKRKPFPEKVMAILDYVFENGWESDFSFEGVERTYVENWGRIMTTPLSPEKEAAAREMLSQMEEARQKSMEQYKKDGLPPFMRSSAAFSAEENPTDSIGTTTEPE